MSPPLNSPLRTDAPASGFTLLEVLAALALCVLLASVTATAVVHSGGSVRRALRLQDQALQLSSLYTQARLRPATLSEAALSPWRIAIDERLTPSPSPHPSIGQPRAEPRPPRRWTLLTLHAPAAAALRPLQLAILENPAP